MAFETLEFRVTTQDGWVLIATNPSYLYVRPATNFPWAIAITASGEPTAPGVSFKPTSQQNGQDFELTSAITGEVYVRANRPRAGDTIEPLRIGVIRNQ